MLVRYGNAVKKINYLSGPISLYYITPKNKQTSLPLLILMGDQHGTEDESGQTYTCDRSFLCREEDDCVKKNRQDCCFSLSNPNFLNVLSEQTDLSYPIDIYTEHWSHEHDKKDKEITYYESDLDLIQKTLSRYTKKSQKKKTITLNGVDEDLLLVKNKGEENKKKKTCNVCRKSITDKVYYETKKKKPEKKERYHVKCTLNLRWQSADARRSFSRKTIENELSNIYWEIDNPRYKLKHHHIYLLLCFMKVNGVYLINSEEAYNKDKTYVFPEIMSQNKYEIDVKHFADCFFRLIMSDECPHFSIIQKEMKKANMNQPEMWKRIYIRSYETYHVQTYQNPYQNLVFFQTMYKKIYYPKKLENQPVFDFVFLPLIHAVSPFLDLYTLLRMFSMTNKKKSVLNIVYTGGFHTVNILRLLTTKDTLYPHYSIDFYSQKKLDFYRQDERCLSITEHIDLYAEISDRRKQLEKIDSNSR